MCGVLHEHTILIICGQNDVRRTDEKSTLMPTGDLISGIARLG